jgi:hypothetical protein
MIQRLLKTALFTGVPFGLFMGLFLALSYGSKVGVPMGFACGLFFGLFVALFTETQRKKMQSKDGTLDGEAILFQGPANHFQNGEGRGGWLTLTLTRLVFRSHGMNIQNQPLNIEVGEILEVIPTLTVGFIPNGLRITLKNGRQESFVVQNRKKWSKVISQEIKAR